jgi:flagellar biosynthetic protein FliR
MPVIAASVALQLVLALLARAAPTMQLFSVGFPVLLLAGLGILVTGLPAMTVGLAEHFGVLGPVLDRLLTTLSSWR